MAVAGRIAPAADVSPLLLLNARDNNAFPGTLISSGAGFFVALVPGLVLLSCDSNCAFT